MIEKILDAMGKDRKEYNAKRWKIYKVTHAKEIKEASQRRLKLERLTVLNHYSNGDIKCSCCGEKNEVFLGLDHVNGKGTAQRKEVGGGSKFYRWLIKNNFPEGFKVSCMNCNWAKHRNGKCVHEKVIEINQVDQIILIPKLN